MELTADQILRESGAFSGMHPDCYSEMTPKRSLSRRRRRWAAEASLEQMCEDAGIQLEAPPPDVACLVEKALRASDDVEGARIWMLHEIGIPQSKIAALHGVTQGAISGRLARIRQRVRRHIDEHEQALLVYHAEVYRLGRYRPLSTRVPLPHELQAARIVIEAHGWETWVLPDEPHVVVLVTGWGESQRQERISYRRAVAMANGLMRN